MAEAVDEVFEPVLTDVRDMPSVLLPRSKVRLSDNRVEARYREMMQKYQDQTKLAIKNELDLEDEVERSPFDLKARWELENAQGNFIPIMKGRKRPASLLRLDKQAVGTPVNTPAAAKAISRRVPVARLVGVELNPGPKGKISKKIKKLIKKKGPLPKRAKARQAQGVFARPVGVRLSSSSAPVSIGYQSVMKNKLRNTIVSHCEQIAEVTAANGSTYSLQVALQINPGLSGSFPWLAQVAANYEAYEFKKLEFYFIPYTSTATTGYNAMNFDYNPQEESSTQFPTKQSFTDYDGSVQCNAWEAFRMPIKCPNVEGPRVRTIRIGNISGQYDLHNYDHGQFNFAVGASTGTGAIGTLYACYSVALMRPRIFVLGTGQNILSGNVTSLAVTKTSMLGLNVTPAMGPDSTLQFGINSSGSVGVANGLIVLNTINNVSLTSNNTYLIAALWTGATLAVVTADTTTIVADAGHYVVVQNGYWGVSQAADTIQFWAVVQMLGIPGVQDHFSVNFSTGITATSMAALNLNITQLPAELAVDLRSKKFDKYLSDKLDKMLAIRQKEKSFVSIEEEKDDDHPPVKNVSKWDVVSTGSNKNKR